MRILQLHNRYKHFGGEDVVMEAEYELLKKNGHQIEQLFFDNKEISSISDKFQAGFGSIYSFSSNEKIQEMIIRFKPELIHIHNFFPLISPSVFYVAKKNKIPVVVTLHNYRLICANALLYRDGNICERCVSKVFPLSGIRYKCYRNSQAQSIAVTLMSSFHKLMGTWKKRISIYIALTEFSKNKFIRSSLNLPPSRVIVKPNFVTDAGFGNEIRGDQFVFIGRLTEEKGVKVLLDSVRFHRCQLKIIGDGPLREFVEKAALENPGIEYVGFKDKKYIMNELKKARGVIFPSIWYEGLPISIIEALSSGTPVIISDLPSLKELIKDHHNGFYFKTGDASDLAKKIEYMNTNKESMKQLYLNARNTYLEKYTPEKNYDLLLNIYQDVIRKYGTKEIN